MRRDDRPVAILLAGPTASGKTELAVALAERLGLGIVSVDSAMVYRGLDIGTAKPDAAILARAPHRLIDIREPDQPYSAAGFRHDALVAMDEIAAMGQTPLLVGGTMLYFRALMHGLSTLPQADPAIRRRLEQDAARLGWDALHARLAQIDPAAARRIHPNDPQRIQRALEVHALTGRPLTELQAAADPSPAPWRWIPLTLGFGDRGVLHERIERRLDAMMAAGFLDEVAGLFARPGLGPELPALRAVGYRQLWWHLEGRLGLDEAVVQAKTATRRLARRQLTWLRGESFGPVFDVCSGHLLDRVLKTLDGVTNS